MTRSFGRGLSDRAARRGDGSAGENRERMQHARWRVPPPRWLQCKGFFCACRGVAGIWRRAARAVRNRGSGRPSAQKDKKVRVLSLKPRGKPASCALAGNALRQEHFPAPHLPLAHASASSPLPCGRGKVVDCGLLVYLNSSKAACGCPRPGSGARDTGRRSRLPGKGEKDARCCFGEGKGT